jgi:DNA polymerase (family 10)
MDNRTIAQKLTSHAHLLESEHSNLYRVKAYRRAAETILGLDEPVEAIVTRTGRKGLRSLPGIGAHLSLAIESLVRTGEFHTLHKENESVSNTLVKQLR